MRFSHGIIICQGNILAEDETSDLDRAPERKQGKKGQSKNICRQQISEFNYFNK